MAEAEVMEMGSDRNKRQYPKRSAYTGVATEETQELEGSDDHEGDVTIESDDSDTSETHAYFGVPGDHEDDATEEAEPENIDDVQLLVFTAMQQDGYEEEDVAIVA